MFAVPLIIFTAATPNVAEPADTPAAIKALFNNSLSLTSSFIL